MSTHGSRRDGVVFGAGLLSYLKGRFKLDSKWRIQEFQNRGCGFGAVEFFGSGACFDAPTHIPCVFSSPELKAQVSFSDHLSSVVCLSVRPSVRPSVCLSVNFLYFHLLLQNHWANFNQTWQKVSLGDGVCSNEGPRPSQRGDNWELKKIN